MNKIKCITVDDDPTILMVLKDLVSQDERLELVCECENSLIAASNIQKYKPDLIFLDIMLPGLDGLEVLDVLDRRPAVIIVSGLENIAEEAARFTEVVDILAKPINPGAFSIAVANAMRYVLASK